MNFYYTLSGSSWASDARKAAVLRAPATRMGLPFFAYGLRCPLHLSTYLH